MDHEPARSADVVVIEHTWGIIRLRIPSNLQLQFIYSDFTDQVE